MRIEIVIEDSPQGVSLSARTELNGCNDYSSQSIAAIIACQLEERFTRECRMGILKVTEK